MSGQGDGCGKINNNDEDSLDSYDDTLEKVVSKEYSLKVHSSEMFDFCGPDPVACYFCTCLINRS